MANLRFDERQTLEHVLGMKSGYVLDLSNSEFSQLIFDTVAIDIYTRTYEGRGNSKANRLRELWSKEDSHTVAIVLEALLRREARHPEVYRTPPINDRDRADCQDIVSRLRSAAETDPLPLVNVGNTHVTFVQVRDEVKRYNEEGRFEVGIDRLHTFLTQYLRLLIAKRNGGAPDEGVPLHSLMGTYAKFIQKDSSPTEMAVRILRSSISTLEAFNSIRNNSSLAHPNDSVLNKHEARFVFSHVIALVRFIEEVEEIAAQRNIHAAPDPDDDIPF
ncbi:abortive infection family protein [Terriglobus sp. 2YAB30_2]|uniref:abortive infection family protein n=1 Tax=unclassified Terriglobus TaxID=2628988 RepID=UPI003F98703A